MRFLLESHTYWGSLLNGARCMHHYIQVGFWMFNINVSLVKSVVELSQVFGTEISNAFFRMTHEVNVRESIKGPLDLPKPHLSANLTLAERQTCWLHLR